MEIRQKRKQKTFNTSTTEMAQREKIPPRNAPRRRRTKREELRKTKELTLKEQQKEKESKIPPNVTKNERRWSKWKMDTEQ